MSSISYDQAIKMWGEDEENPEENPGEVLARYFRIDQNKDNWLFKLLYHNCDEMGEYNAIRILEGFKKNKPSKLILNDLKKKINENKSELIVYFNENNRLIFLLLYFGLDILYLEFRYKLDKDDFQLTEEEYKKMIAGFKIVRFVEEYMDDEFEMRNMRSLIDMRRIKDGK
jgi:hypothetical protein